ncbi:MAG: recombination mediator RecR [Prevotellaceae bacterium]|jgi:recombination protein RecR|nr:recombination mediator RecR [Prevotellaceae bacterium]
MDSELSSILLNSAVDEFAKLPGVGRKTALRLVLHLLKQPAEDVEKFGNAFIKLRNEIKHCKICNNLSDSDICEICSNQRRSQSIICVVESIRDVLSIERTQQFNGLYHVLGGIISPMDGIAPSDLNIDLLVQRIKNRNVKEVVLALNTTMEGETTCYYLHKKISALNIEITALARGVNFGDELEYTDELTLGKSILNRQPFIK